ncbi:MAG: hypothetical protein IJU79_01755, partial [Desulfovibrionaceae bacterium]|nr:hypothetical protein [Desulfovibrionaceae bacterium]
LLHKKARHLVDRYDAIGIENISVKVMAKHKKGGKFSIGQVCSGQWLEYVCIHARVQACMARKTACQN